MADRCWEKWPTDAVDTDTLAQRLSGRRMEGQPSLADVFPPREASARVGRRHVTRSDAAGVCPVRGFSWGAVGDVQVPRCSGNNDI